MAKTTLRSFDFLGADAHFPIINKNPNTTITLAGRRCGALPFSSLLSFTESISAQYSGGYIGFFLYIGGIPSAPGGVSVMWRDKIGGENLIRMTMNSTYQIRLEYRSAVSTWSTISADISSALAINTWHRIEIKYDVNITTYALDVALRVNKTVVASVTGLNAYNTGDAYGDAGEIYCPLTNGSFYISDYFCVEDQFLTNWWYDWEILLINPTSDGQVGSWTAGAGGLTNLYDAVNNNPPIGTATETNLTQIESVDISGDNTTDEYRANFGSFTDMGFQTGDKLGSGFGLGQPASLHISHGEDVATGAKTLSAYVLHLGVYAGSPLISATFGPIASGALGTWPTNWVGSEAFVAFGTFASFPYDFTTPVYAAIRKTDTGSRVGSISYVGLQVLRQLAYPPTVARLPASTIRPFRHLLTR